VHPALLSTAVTAVSKSRAHVKLSRPEERGREERAATLKAEVERGGRDTHGTRYDARWRAGWLSQHWHQCGSVDYAG
jgi:hypothetical protein